VAIAFAPNLASPLRPLRSGSPTHESETACGSDSLPLGPPPENGEVRRSPTDVDRNSTPKVAPCQRFYPSGFFGFSRGIFTGRMKRERTEASSGGALTSAGITLTYQRATMPRAMRSASAMHVSMGFTAGLPGKIPVSVM
jgi:hypothetical protein